jgi:hypothetical protein
MGAHQRALRVFEARDRQQRSSRGGDRRLLRVEMVLMQWAGGRSRRLRDLHAAVAPGLRSHAVQRAPATGAIARN